MGEGEAGGACALGVKIRCEICMYIMVEVHSA